MNTFASITVFASMLSLGAAAYAQDNGGIVGPMPRKPATNCYKLQNDDKACVVAGPVVVDIEHPRFKVVDLNGAWKNPNDLIPYIYIYADPQRAGGYTITIDQSLFNMPDAFGYFVDSDTISMVFPDQGDFTGEIGDGKIYWSNGTVWTKQ